MHLPSYERAALVGEGATAAATRNALKALLETLGAVKERQWGREALGRAIEKAAEAHAVPPEAIRRTLKVALGLDAERDRHRPAMEMQRLGKERSLEALQAAISALSDVA